MLPILLVTGWLFKASVSLITGYGNSTADYGGDAQYGCTVARSTGVLQVTWQRLSEDEDVENLATYSERFGRHVNEPYRGKVVLTEASLGSSSITLKNVTWEDTSCYICSFNAYPDGSERRQTCLTVEGVSEVKTGARAPVGGRGDGATEAVVFSCSATGKPAPTIQWAYSPGASPLSQPPTSTVANGDGTFASSRNVTLRVPADWSGHADCLLNAGMAGQRRERIPFSLGAGDGKEAEEEGTRFPSPGVAVVICAVVVLCIIVAAAVKRKRLKDKARIENV